MKLIRKGVFETNSSSSHSISIAGEDKEFVLDTIYPDENGLIVVRGKEFGWAWDKINNAEKKLAYLFQGGVNKELIKEVVMEQTGATKVKFKNGKGVIDHQSSDLAKRMCIDKKTIKDFIFNKNSWLFTGNDNSSPSPTFYHVPEYKDGKKILPEYKYELSINGIKNTIKYVKYPTLEEIENGIDSLLEEVMIDDEDKIIFLDDYVFWDTPKNLYRKEYMTVQDYSRGYVIMTRETAIYDIKSQLKLNEEYCKSDYKQRRLIITEELLKSELNSKKLNFTLKNI